MEIKIKMKKFFSCVTLLLALTFFWVSGANALTSNYTTFIDGNILSAADLNNLQTHYKNADNNILDGDIFTGDMSFHTGDAIFYSDTGATKTAHIDAATGSIIGAPKTIGVPNNLNIINVTSASTNDSIRIQCGGASCSATNPGYIWLPDDDTAGYFELFKQTEDVTITLTGAHWGAGGNGNISDAILRVSPVNANGSLVWCVNYVGGHKYIDSSLDSTTASNVNLAEEYLCSAAISSNDPMVDSVFHFYANFNDTGDVWEVQTDDGDLNVGSADGLYQPYNIQISLTGGSGNTIPEFSTKSARFTQIGNQYFADIILSGDGGNEGAGTGVMTLSNPIDLVYVNSAGHAFPCGRSRNSTSSYITNGELQSGGDTIQLNYFSATTTVSSLTGAQFDNATRMVRCQFQAEIIR